MQKSILTPEQEIKELRREITEIKEQLKTFMTERDIYFYLTVGRGARIINIESSSSLRSRISR